MPVHLPSASDLVRGVTILRSLYDVSPGPSLVSDSALRGFVRKTLSSLASGRTKAVLSPRSYFGLIGRGGGFTPAGDDFVGSFVATYNYIARCRESRQISIPPALIFSRTIPESAAILGYSARGYVDEGLERLVLETLGGRSRGFHDVLLDVASRGHTSGVDMSLGVLFCEAALSDALTGCIEALWHQ
jgi:hypothetical protein